MGLGGRALRRWFWCGSGVIEADFGVACVSGEVIGLPRGGGTGDAVGCGMVVEGFMQ